MIVLTSVIAAGYAGAYVASTGAGLIHKPERRYRPGADWSLVPSPRPPMRTVSVWRPDMLESRQEPEEEPKPKRRRKVQFEDGPATGQYINPVTGEVVESELDLTQLVGWDKI